MQTPLWNLSPVGSVLLVGMAVAALPLLALLRHGRAGSSGALVSALTLTTLFLTFDLVLFGAFTRLTDSGLGCPDWPGCYGQASPLGAHDAITQAVQRMPEGPVTHSKAWIEMVHRYLATGVGFLILVLAFAAWRAHRQARSGQGGRVPHPAWAGASLVWVCAQGLFGALTVTMKLFPAIVSLHLLGGYTLLALLTVQAAQWARLRTAAPVQALPLRANIVLFCALLLVLVQAACGAWVSTNYAVLACMEFPTCQGSYWPAMDFAGGFSLWRPLGLQADGSPISFAALTAIHMVHRWGAGLLTVALIAVVWYLRALPGLRTARRVLALLLLVQLATGLSNVVLGWPLVGAVLHTGGAGAMVVTLVWMLVHGQAQSSLHLPAHTTLREAT
jgi:cytochrome c oxidase assembly protein subunit 15